MGWDASPCSGSPWDGGGLAAMWEFLLAQPSGTATSFQPWPWPPWGGTRSFVFVGGGGLRGSLTFAAQGETAGEPMSPSALAEEARSELEEQRDPRGAPWGKGSTHGARGGPGALLGT